MPVFEFTLTIRGCGADPDSAYLNAIEALNADPGETPTAELVEDEEG